MKERRKSEKYKLRTYMDAIKDAKMTTEAQWIKNWVKGNCKGNYVTRTMWISYLEKCVLKEAEVFFELKAS